MATVRRDSNTLKQESATVYFRERVNGVFEYVEGIVLDFKPVRDANEMWDQNWKRKYGTILKIACKDKRVEDRERARYRHMSSVLNKEQFDRRKKKERSKQKR